MEQVPSIEPVKVRIFISSSTEQLPLATALEQGLQGEGFEPQLWSHGVHGASQYNLESLLKLAVNIDFALFICTPDDKAVIRKKEFAIVRDNVIFEIGLLMGAIGREQCLIVQPSDLEMRLPSDLHGVTALKYGNQLAAENITKITKTLIAKIKQHVHKVSRADEAKFTGNEILLLQNSLDINTPSYDARKADLSEYSESFDKLCVRFLHLLEHGLIESIGSREIHATQKGKLLLQAMSQKK